MAIFLFMTLVSIVACVLDSKILTPIAAKFTIKSQLRILGDFVLSSSPARDPSLQVITEHALDPFAVPDNELILRRCSSADSLPKCFKALSPEQATVVQRSLNKLPKDSQRQELSEAVDFMKLSRLQKFEIIMWAAHPISSIWTSRCHNVARKTSIFVLYIRWVYELALSMFFNFGLNNQNSDQLQILFVRCLYSIICVTVFAGVIKKFVRHDCKLNMSAILFCKPKLQQLPPLDIKENRTFNKLETKESVQTPASPAIAVNTIKKSQRKSWYQRSQAPSIHKVSPATSIVIENQFKNEPISHDKVSIQISDKAKGSNREIPSVNSPSKTPTQPGCKELCFILMSYGIMYGLLLGSVFLIIALSQQNDKNGQWPFGWWYLCQFGLSSTFGSLFSILVQWCLFTHRVKHLKQRTIKTPWIVTRHFFFNGEVFELADLVASVTEAPVGTVETSVKSSTPSFEDLPDVAKEAKIA